jgi:hypothetical protein
MFERFSRDERAIEGLPVRLVIALVVGVASLSVMLTTIDGLDTLGVSEVDVEPEPAVLDRTNQTVEVQVVDADGRPVADATVIAKDGTATLSTVHTVTTGEDGTGTLDLNASLGPNQREGTVRLDVKPPADGQYVDRRENTKVLVMADGP